MRSNSASIRGLLGFPRSRGKCPKDKGGARFICYIAFGVASPSFAACAANTRGSHDSGRCNIAKYGDYVVAGNLVLLCQGRDSETALQNCEALHAALQN